MSKPLVVTIPHRLGKDEAVRRLKAGIGQARTNFAQMMTVEEETWQDDHLTFHIRALAQAVSGTLAVAEDHATLEVQLPWLLHTIAEKARTSSKGFAPTDCATSRTERRRELLSSM